MRWFAGVTVLVLLAASALAGAEVDVPLVVHQALRPGVEGVDSKAIPVTVGIPFARGAVREVSGRPALAVQGASLYQFRTLRRWPDGSVEWALADFQTDLGANAENRRLTVVPGSGASDGTPLARKEGDQIVVDTGALMCEIRTKGFNLFDSVKLGNTEIVPGIKSPGVLCYGPEG